MAAQALRFASKVDRLLLLAGAVPLLASTIACAYLALSFREPTVWVAAGLMLAADALVAWIYLGTHYSIREEQLRIQCGPFRWQVTLGEIRSVLPSGSMLSSPALSLDRLEIRHGRQGSILVSPAERMGFLEALARASPGLVASAGGLRRVARHDQ